MMTTMPKSFDLIYVVITKLSLSPLLGVVFVSTDPYATVVDPLAIKFKASFIIAWVLFVQTKAGFQVTANYIYGIRLKHLNIDDPKIQTMIAIL